MIRVGNKTVSIKLSNGGVITVPRSPELERGAKVEVDWDYTKEKARAIWLYGQGPERMEPEGKPVNIDNFEEELDKGLGSRAFMSPTFEGIRGEKKPYNTDE